MGPESEEKGIDALIQTMIEHEAEFRDAVLAKVRSDISPAKLSMIYDEVAVTLDSLLPAVFRALITGEGLDEEDITPVRQAAERWAARGVTLRTVGEVGIACAEAAIMMTRVLARRSELHAGADLAVMVSFGRGVMISQQAMTALFAGHARGMLNRHRSRPAADPTVAPVRAVASRPAAVRRPVEPPDDGDPGELRQPGADILRMVAEGRTNVEIAAALHLSRQAVNYHVGRLMRALGASNRTALVARAYQRGLLLLTG